MIVRCKGPERIVLVSDAMAAAGAPPGTYTLGDLTLTVRADRVARQPGQSNFAGSALTMPDAVSRLMIASGMGLRQAWDAASAIPARLLGLPPARDRVIANVRDNRLQVAAVAG